ncbi:MAG: TonB-dependent receptor, partial [Sphingobacteriales bacterium]
VYSQHTLIAIVADSSSGERLPGAVVALRGTNQGAVSDLIGAIRLENIPEGTHTIGISMIGYDVQAYSLSFPLISSDTLRLLLHASSAHLEEIIVEGTRSNRSIANTPTRVEVLTEEIDEASTMDPSKVAHLLTHSTGIQVQQTSATSNTANVRIQGLDGRYTQILKDGFPLYGGFSGSLSIMQIPPLDLRQVEYIKGSASTLYGGGAIAGLINLISKEPAGNETLVHLNASHIGAFDVNTFLSRKIEKMGITLLAQRNVHRPYDADGDGYTDMPALTKYNFNPKVFYNFSGRTKLSAGGTFTQETRRGGDMELMDDAYPTATHFYQEKNNISRVTTQTRLDHSFSDTYTLSLRNSFNIFNRSLSVMPSPALDEYRFAGRQLSSFSEAALTARRGQAVLIAGLNYYTDEFRETRLRSATLRNEGYNTLGAFANYTFDPTSRISVEAGLRTDYVFDEKLFVLPRLSALFKWTDKLTTRIGGGLGYRNPTIFNQEAELLGYKDVTAIDKSQVKAEQSYGGNADIGFKTPLGDRFFLNVNQMFFYTYLDKPLILVNEPWSGMYRFMNAPGSTRSYGSETFFKFGFYDFVLFVGYTYTHATNHFGSITAPVTLTPTHSLKGDLLYSLPGKWRIGMDYEYKSSQTLSSGLTTPGYWTYGALVEHTWKAFTFFGNIENFTDVRQTKYGSIRSLPYHTPQFTEVWAPLDGVVFNYGVKLRM